jgi:hypothetical protein
MSSVIIDELSRALSRTYPICQPKIGCAGATPTITRFDIEGSRLHRRLVASVVATDADAGIAWIMFPSQLHSANEARLLLPASRATCGQSQGRNAVNHANRPGRNWPLASIKRSMEGKLKSNSSEITFTTPNPAPRLSAARATAAPSMSTACAPNDSRRLAFWSGLATDPKLTSMPSP